MRFTRLRLQSWRNFRNADIALQRRVFILGPNASGKSNFLQAFKFLRGIAEPEGGLRRAVEELGGVSQIRCLHARRYSTIIVDAEMEIAGSTWRYCLEFSQDNQRRPVVKAEKVWCGDQNLLSRPDEEDREDPTRLTQTHLEQINANREFRPIVDFLAKVRYLHVVPQLIRETGRVVPREDDPYGTDFLEQLALTPDKTRQSRLRRINRALQVAVPQLKELKLERDDRGVPHLKGLYEHWRPKAGWQGEEQLSDGTLRLLGLLWAILDGEAPLLLEEPELSLHVEVIRHIPAMIARAGAKRSRQVLISSHSPDLLADEGIAAEEVILLVPTPDGTEVRLAAQEPEIQRLREAGLTLAEAVLPRTAPPEVSQLALFGA